MDFLLNYKNGANAWQIHFSRPLGICVSPFKRYRVIIIEGQITEWCEETAKLTYKSTFELEKDQDYKIVADLTCWDLLELMEMEHITVEALLDICYPPIRPTAIEKETTTDSVSEQCLENGLTDVLDC